MLRKTFWAHFSSSFCTKSTFQTYSYSALRIYMYFLEPDQCIDLLNDVDESVLKKRFIQKWQVAYDFFVDNGEKNNLLTTNHHRQCCFWKDRKMASSHNSIFWWHPLILLKNYLHWSLCNIKTFNGHWILQKVKLSPK